MEKPERKHQTRVLYYVEDFSGEREPKEIEVDLSKISNEELDQLIFQVPEATSEIVYRELYGQ
jgi:hypothetical protein